MINFGKVLAEEVPRICFKPFIICLRGELGAGKTTLVRGFLRAFGFKGRVKSPTFTILEPYQIQDQTIYHLDLYRLNNECDLEYIGIRDYLATGAIFLIEWPEKAEKILPVPDLIIDIKLDPKLLNKRHLYLQAATEYAARFALKKF